MSRAARPPGMICVRMRDLGRFGSRSASTPGKKRMNAPVQSHQPQPTMSPIMSTSTAYLKNNDTHC